ncbi:MAG TPA: outer membrane lipoprotein carrier protein LolA [Arenibaculum sp.]|nr:outer membrane lipoprotein carrier protein LolA [Arenibaculum sp.]
MKHRGSLPAVIVALLLAAGGALAPSPAPAAPAAVELTERDRADIARIEDYLSGIRTLRSRFLQASPDGTLARGTFYMQRPGRMRLEYDEPNGNYVVADGWFIYFWDDELKQQSNAPIGSTLADLILRDGLKLSGDVSVTGIERGPGVIEVELVETKDPGKGRITLVFEDDPLRLRKWRVLDAQGLTTEVALLNPEMGVPLDRKLFVFIDPNFGRPRDN